MGWRRPDSNDDRRLHEIIRSRTKHNGRIPVKNRTRVSSIYKKEILTVLVMGINKSDTINF